MMTTMLVRLALLLLLVAIPVQATMTPVGACKQAARQMLRATLRDCRLNGGMTTTTTTTTTSTTTATVLEHTPLDSENCSGRSVDCVLVDGLRYCRDPDARLYCAFPQFCRSP